MRKPTKPLWKISVVSSAEAEDAICEFLQQLLPEAPVAYTDVETREVTVTSYVSEKPQWTRLRQEIAIGISRIAACGLSIGPAKISLRKVPREDWAESWKRHFKPIEIGSCLLVKPSWSKREPKPNQAVVILDPGLSFGTGQHPTTSFCLRQLVNCKAQETDGSVKHGRPSLLDIGTGSGILAIAAAKIGYGPVEAFDFDPEAVRVARANASKNRVHRRIALSQADLTRLPKRGATQFDVICANLISNLLISERGRVIHRLKPGGRLILAGILEAEFAEVRQAFEALGLRFISGRTENEWRSGLFSRPE